MNVVLEKDGEQRSYHAGNAMYLLFNFIPILGSLIAFVLMISKKQFRGIFLNQFVLGLIISVVTSIFTKVGVNSKILMFISAILGLYVLIMYVLNANYYSIKQRLDEGFVVINANVPEVQMAVQKAESIKKPFWQLTRF